MTGFTFSAEELRTAPPAVRRWLESLIVAALAPAPPAEPGPQPSAAPGAADEALPDLAICTEEEAVRVLELLRDDAPATRVFLELARELRTGRNLGHLHAIGVEDMLHYAHVADSERLYACLAAIGRAFETTRGGVQAPLFALDDGGFLYVHETTHRNVRQVWDVLAASSPAAGAAEPAERPLPFATFVPRRLGPSETVAPGPAAFVRRAGD